MTPAPELLSNHLKNPYARSPVHTGSRALKPDVGPRIYRWTMPADWDLLEEVYAFARERQVRRVDKAVKKRLDRTLIDRETSHLRMLQWYYAEAKNTGTNSAIAAAIDVFRKAAMQDQGHPDYDPLWTIPAK